MGRSRTRAGRAARRAEAMGPGRLPAVALAAAVALMAAVALGLAAACLPLRRPDQGTWPSPAAHPPAATPAPPATGDLAAALQEYAARLPGTWGIWVLDLTRGTVVAVGADRHFPAASTLKVPLVMMVLEGWARGDVDLDERLVLDQEHRQPGTGILGARPPGSDFTLRTLAELAITHSDNTAARLLLERYGQDALYAYMRGLGGTPEYREGLTHVTPREMGAYLHEAWTGTRLGARGRALLLGWLERSAFPVRLRQGIPAAVPVAHKIGTLPGAIHDVGIVLDPGRPFILAVMSAGAPEPVAEPAIAGFAAIVYGHLSRD